jgi:tRNA A-37 threonylcarbamoyl transferase component Bud32
MVGRQIHRYRIVEQIGSGGMAVVYKGVDTALDREVAVKVLHPHLASKEESRRRFTREAKAVAKLHHRNILEIYDFSGDDGAESYIVTEYIRGKTLRKLGEEEPFHPPEIAAMAAHELASALEHAHAIGVIHRDLKPENVMIRDDGIVKLTDFGIAKIIDRDERMTMTGALVGSPAHMAPEVIEGVEAGAEADIFSLGTILYWLCTRKLPFTGNNTTQTLKLILDGKYEDPRIGNAAVSDDLAVVLSRCLARDPAARFPRASALREALSTLLAEAGIDHPGEELANFFADPAGYRTQFSKQLVARLVDRADAFVKAGRNPKALDCVNRVIALDPTNSRALEILGRMKRRRRAARAAWLGSGAIGIAALVSLGAAWFVNGRAPSGGLPTPSGGAEVAPLVSKDDKGSAPVRPASFELPAPRAAAMDDGAAAPKPVVPEAAPPAVSAVSVAQPEKSPAERSKSSDLKRNPVERREPKSGKPQPIVAAVQPTEHPTATSQGNATGHLSATVWGIQAAEIYVDDRRVGMKNLDMDFSAGKHRLVVKHRCCEDYEQVVELAAGQQFRVPEIHLTPKASFLTITAQDAVPAPVILGDVDDSTWFKSGRTGEPIRIDMPKVNGEWHYNRIISIEVKREGYQMDPVRKTVLAGNAENIAVELTKK